MHTTQSMRPQLCLSVSQAPHGYRKDTSFCYIARLATTPYTTTTVSYTHLTLPTIYSV